MAHGKSLMLKAMGRYRKAPEPLPSVGSRDRSLAGKARIRARRAARKVK